MLIDYKKELNEEQYEAVTTTEGPLLILAAAGSGKTRCLIYRVSYLIESGVNPNEILLLTFTNKAADEMKQRAAAMLDERCGQITACTYHSFCNMLLRRFGGYINLPPNFTVLSPSDTNNVIEIIKTEKGYKKDRAFPKPSIISSIISSSINTNRPLAVVVQDERYSKYRWYISEIEKIAEGYKAYKQTRSLVDYDDMLVLVMKLFKEHPEVASMVESGYRYIMVDEYQDSNAIQDKIITTIRKDNHNICVVGDDYQCIYGFRGSDVQNIINFPVAWDGCKTVILHKNYRSSDEIVKFANRVMEMHATEGYKKDMSASFATNDKPQVIHSRGTYDEASFICSEIEEMLGQSKPMNEIAVLERAANSSSLLEGMLTTKGIPFVKYGGPRFLDKEHVQDVLSFLRCIENQYDELAWFRILQIFYGVGKQYAQKISALAETKGVNLLIDHPYTNRAFHKDLFSFYWKIAEWKQMPPETAMDEIVTYYIDHRKKLIETMRVQNEATRMTYMEELTTQAEDLQVLKALAGKYDTIEAFLDVISVDGNVNQNETENKEESVIISTIHSAKGLEYDTVFLLDNVDGVFPRTANKIGTKEDNEELRCFYVAITRAKKKLYLMVPENCPSYGKFIAAQPSHYLAQTEAYTETRKVGGATYV